MPGTVGDLAWIVTTILTIYDNFLKRFMRVEAHKTGIISTVDSSHFQWCLEPKVGFVSSAGCDLERCALPYSGGHQGNDTGLQRRYGGHHNSRSPSHEPVVLKGGASADGGSVELYLRGQGTHGGGG